MKNGQLKTEEWVDMYQIYASKLLKCPFDKLTKVAKEIQKTTLNLVFTINFFFYSEKQTVYCYGYSWSKGVD